MEKANYKGYEMNVLETGLQEHLPRCRFPEGENIKISKTGPRSWHKYKSRVENKVAIVYALRVLCTTVVMLPSIPTMLPTVENEVCTFIMDIFCLLRSFSINVSVCYKIKPRILEPGPSPDSSKYSALCSLDSELLLPHKIAHTATKSVRAMSLD
jgi:hypothetical protein